MRLDDSAHLARLQRLASPTALDPMAETLLTSAQAVVDYARHNINDGAISGSGHVPGPPHGFPNSDTHELEQSLHVGDLMETPSEMKTAAIADAPYAIFVEMGTSRMLPRPFMQMSVSALRPEILRAIAKRFGSILKRG